MKTEELTAKQCQHAKPRAQRYEIPAGRGLYFVVHPTGRKGWALRYRYAGKTRNLTFEKSYPEMPLATARAEAERKLDELETGKDPAAIQEAEVRQAEPNGVEAIADLWLKRKLVTASGAKKASYGEYERILKKEVFPAWKHKLITDVTKGDINLLLDKTVDRGAAVLANKILAILKGWFKWAAKRDYIPFSPAAMIDRPTEEESRDRVLSEDELREIWNAAPGMGYPFGSYFRLAILTGQRRGEVASMRWQHVDLEKGLWTLPKTSTKAKRVHDVPLSGAAVLLLRELPRFKKGDYVFTTQSGAVAISGFSKGKAAIDKAILKHLKESDPDSEGLEEWHIHDFRRTMATWLGDNGTPIEVVGAILNHAPGSTMRTAITAVYARSRFAKEKRSALQAWGNYVVSLEAQKKAKATA